MFPMAISSKSEPLLYDVRLHGTDHDVVLLKGPPDSASSVLLSGTVVLSIRDPIQIKNLSLRMYGRIRLNIPVQYQSAKGPTQRTAKYERTFYEHTWDNLNINSYFENLYDNYGKRASINSKSSGNLVDLPKKSKSSTTSLISLTGLGSSSNVHQGHHTLLQGNYEFPFSAILPGSLVESVEGLPNASITYKLEATIERSKFYSDLICKKHVRVVRTLSPDAVELSETMAVDNTWPNKVAYSISVPAKAIAIGSLTPIHIEVVPLKKGLRLGQVKATLMENSQYCSNLGNVSTQERTVGKIKLKDPLNHVKTGTNDSGEDDSTFQDRWQIDTFLQVPASLSKCTQDSTLLNSIKVRHKLKFVISLINPDGHVSELRASLPAQLFISPFVALTIKNSHKPENGLGTSSNSSGRHNSNDDDENDEDVLFGTLASELELANMVNDPQVPSTVPDLMSPPNYESHIYDRLWSDISVSNTPRGSGTQTPIEGQSIGQVLNSQQNVKELETNLLRLHSQIQKGLDRSTPTSNINPSGYNRNPAETSSYTASSNNAGTNSVSPASPVRRVIPLLRSGSMPLVDQHLGVRGVSKIVSPDDDSQHDLSRSHSSLPLKNPQSPTKEMALDNLSRVPSYEKAMKSESADNDLPPMYPEDEDPLRDGDDLERPQVLHHRAKSSSFIKKSNASMIPGPRQQRILFRAGSSSSISGLPPPPQSHADLSSNKSQIANKHLSFGMTPVEHPVRTLSKDSMHQRSGSLSNLKNLLKTHKK